MTIAENPALAELQKIAGRVSPAGAADQSAGRKRALLEGAIAACCGDRHLNYGKPEDNFLKIATLWNAWNSIRKPGPVEPWEVPVFMGLMKFARLAHAPGHRDSWLDIAGYAACGADITGAK